MTPPTIFDRDNAPDAQGWLNSTRSFYEPRNHPSDHVTNADGTAQAGGFVQLHSRCNNDRSQQDHG